MIALKTFAKFANIKLTDFNPKPTTKTPGQVEASDILWESDDGKTKLVSGNVQKELSPRTERVPLNFVISYQEKRR